MFFFKVLFFVLLLSNYSSAKYQKIKVGFIDKHYENILTKRKIISILKEKENRVK